MRRAPSGDAIRSVVVSGFRATFTALLAAVLLAACATHSTLGPVDLAGRLAVRIEGQPERSVSAGFELGGTSKQGRLVLTGPLGTISAQAGWSPSEAWLLANGERHVYPNLDELAAAALGEPIPIAALFDWLRGQPWAGSMPTPRLDGTPGFEQLGWRIDLSRRADSIVEAIRVAPPMVTVRARLEQH